MNDDLPDLDATGLLAAAGRAVRERRRAEVRELEVLAQWAAVHSGDPDSPWDRLVQLGGEGSPKVQDLCLGEIALARGAGVTATTNALADALDLQHRMPKTWTRCTGGQADLHVARRVAQLSRHLPADKVGLVDRAVARIIGHESGGRVLEVAEAKIIEADPALHDARVEAERTRRYVSSGRTDEYGLRTVIARVEAGDAVWVEATVARVSEIIAPLHPVATPDELRSIAFGWLARPAELLQLLLEHRSPQEILELDLGGVDEQSPAPSRAMAFPTDLLDALKTTDLRALAPKVTLFVHLHEAAVQGADGVARVEGLGPQTLAQLQVLLAGAQVTVKPVIDLSERIRTIAYEHPESLKERVHLTVVGDYWPYATSTSFNIDYDHPTEFDDTGSPGQTGTHNSGPLGRRHHRYKTHGTYRARQCGAGRYVWLTPHGLAFIVDHDGTRRISVKHAQMILDAPPGLDIYPQSTG